MATLGGCGRPIPILDSDVSTYTDRALQSCGALNEIAARQLTETIRQDAQALWSKLLQAYNGGAHLALGYSNWATYCAEEFEIGRTRSYQLLEAARVVAAIESQSTMVDSTTDHGISTERTAREFAGLADNPDKLNAAHQQALAATPDDGTGKRKISAKTAREAVQAQKRPAASGGQRVRPTTAPEPTAPIGLNTAVSALKRAIQADPKSARQALETLRTTAARGLYTPETRDAPAAVRDLVEVVGTLLEKTLEAP